MIVKSIIALVFLLAQFSAVIPAWGSDYGTTGLIDVPTARFTGDGVMSASGSVDGRHKQVSITYQIAPWIQGTFRYTGYDDYFYHDRNYEVKVRLSEEDQLIPEVALGVRDIVGTGNFGSEYVVASKRVGGTDVTLGLGWGRLAGKGQFTNPLLRVSDRFETREEFSGEGGEIATGQFFSGRSVGLFGGVSKSFETFPFTMALEYNPDQYNKDFVNGVPRPISPWSVGLTWHFFDELDLRLSLQHGTEIGVGFTSYLDSKKEAPRREQNAFISSYYLSQEQLPKGFNKRSWYDRLLLDVERSGLILVEGSLSEDQKQAKLVVGNASYALWSDAVGRLTALADLHLPATVKVIHFVAEDAGHRSITVVVPRPSSAYSDDSGAHLRSIRLQPGQTLDTPQHRTDFVTGKINNTVNLRSRFQLFDPDDPARYQVYADLSSEYSLSSHWAIRSTFSINIDQNFDESNRKDSGSVLPRVRSDVVRYLDEGASGLDKLIIEGRNTYGSSLHYRGFAGVMEEMFSGAGGEVLYWPSKSRVAVGASVAYAKQRGYDRRLDHLDYDVITGHVSAYWASPFYNYDVAVHAGQYLAKDVGATLEVRRTFRNGWQVGAWATMTDVSSEDFGEGSFDKGFYFQLPLDSIFGGNTRSKFGMRMRPIQRDGGQRLESYSGNIFFDLREARYDAFAIDKRLLP